MLMVVSTHPTTALIASMIPSKTSRMEPQPRTTTLAVQMDGTVTLVSVEVTITNLPFEEVPNIPQARLPQSMVFDLEIYIEKIDFAVNLDKNHNTISPDSSANC